MLHVCSYQHCVKPDNASIPKTQTPLHGHRLRTWTTPPTDTTNGRAHNNSTTNLPHRSARAQLSTCPDVGMWQIFVRLWWLCCTTSCRIVVSSSVGGVVQHVRSRCPCSGVWHYTSIQTSLLASTNHWNIWPCCDLDLDPVAFKMQSVQLSHKVSTSSIKKVSWNSIRWFVRYCPKRMHARMDRCRRSWMDNTKTPVDGRKRHEQTVIEYFNETYGIKWPENTQKFYQDMHSSLNYCKFAQQFLMPHLTTKNRII